MNVYTDGQPPAFSCWRRLFWLPSGGIRSTSCSVSLRFGQLVAAPTAMCLVSTNSPGGSPHRFCVPPLIRRLRAAPSPRGRFFSFPLGVYVPPKASPWGSWQGAALTDEGRYRVAEREGPGEFVYPRREAPLPSQASEGARRRLRRGHLAGLPC